MMSLMAADALLASESHIAPCFFNPLCSKPLSNTEAVLCPASFGRPPDGAFVSPVDGFSRVDNRVGITVGSMYIFSPGVTVKGLCNNEDPIDCASRSFPQALK